METATTAARASAIAGVPDLTEQEWVELCESLHAECRVKYKKEIADYIERFGEEPSLGTLLGAEVRAECNNHTSEQRRAGALRAMSRIRSQAVASSHEPAAACR